jgi:N-acylneuraminate cytidylyltransferase
MGSLDPILAVIPARGGSKGLPGKNIRPLAGLPLIAHSIKLAALCPQIERCIVSTDSEEIAAAARAHGGDVPFLRPAELATDQASTMPVLKHALETVEAALSKRYRGLVLLQPTSPVRLPEDVARAVAMLEADEKLDGVVACSQPSWNPFYLGVVEKEGRLQPAFGHFERRQLAPKFLRVNGVLYVWRRRFVEKPAEPWLEAPHAALELPDDRAIDIDTAEDFAEAERLLAEKKIALPWLR